METGYIEFFTEGEAKKFHPNIIKKDGIGFIQEFEGLREFTILTDRGNFIVRDGFIYNWNTSLSFYKAKIETLFGYSDIKEINEFLRKNIFNKEQKCDFKNYERNVNLLLSFVYLGEAENTSDEEVKREWLEKSEESRKRFFEGNEQKSVGLL